MKFMLIFPIFLLASIADGSALFDDNSILEVTLIGPISTLIKHRHTPEEYEFMITANGVSRQVRARARGNSRLVVCPFPPIRLNFDKSEPKGTIFAEEGKLKLVTHCRSGNEDSQDSILNEYTAYRIFNLISDKSYRVRLLRIRYEDTDGKQKKLEEPYYGYVIESDESLAERFGGSLVNISEVRYSELDMEQTARLSIFQYLLGNKDWSLVTAEGKDTCCHNIDLFGINGALTPIPYDFDLATLTFANYRTNHALVRSKHRVYRGYCRTPDEAVESAIVQVQALKSQIMDAIRDIPVRNERTRERRRIFAAEYFDEAADTDALVTKIRQKCVP